MSKRNEWEPVGTVYAPKPKKKSNFSDIAFGVFAFVVILGLLAQCGG